MIQVPNTGDINQWISQKFSILAEIVQDYDSDLELRWIPPDQRTRDDKKPYVVVDKRTNTPVQYADESDVPEEILARVIEGDNKNGSVLKKLEAYEAAHKMFVLKEHLNKMEEANEQAKFFLKSPLNWINFNGKKFDDQRRIVGTTNEKKHL